MARKDNTSAGKYTRRIIIQNPPGTDDGQGGQTGSWTDAYPCWANIVDFPFGRGAGRAFFAQQLYPTMTTMIAIRYQTSFHIDASKKVKYVRGPTTHLYKILGAKNPDEANKEILLFCQEDQAKGAN